MASIKEQIELANAKAVEAIVSSKPVLVDVRRAIDVIPDMSKETILHSGPPVSWEKMCGPQKGGVVAAAIYEGLAADWEETETRIKTGEIKLDPCHHHATVGSMTGVTSASMWVHCVKNKTAGNSGYCAIYEGRGNTSAFGGYDQKVIERLRWMDEVLGPILQTAVKNAKEIDLRTITARALTMGDECHNRCWASTLLFVDALFPSLVEADYPKSTIARVVDFVTKPHYNYFLTLSMPACKSALDAAHGLQHSTIVTTMARNGTEFGIRVSGMGDQWFTAPAPVIAGSYFPGFTAEDANPDMGDSSITETCGLGGFAMAASPAITQLVGGSPADAVNYTKSMGQITATKNGNYLIPYLGFQGTPTAIDIRRVLDTGINPVIDTGIAHKKPGIGMVGAGITKAPMETFQKAFESFVKTEGIA
jgi:hypothetical protein